MTRATVALITDATRRTFPGERCAGRTSWTFNATRKDMAGYFDDAAAIAYVDECRVLITPLEKFSDVCRIAAHEVGHLGGRVHIDDPNNLMYEGAFGDAIVPACVRAERIWRRNGGGR